MFESSYCIFRVSVIQKYQAQKCTSMPVQEGEVRERKPFAINLLLFLATQLLREIMKPRHMTNRVLIADASNCQETVLVLEAIKKQQAPLFNLSLKRICLLFPCLQNSA